MMLAPAPALSVMTGPHAPPAEAKELFARRRGPGELWLVPGAGHADVCEAGGLSYQRRILAFLDRWLFASRPAQERTGAA